MFRVTLPEGVNVSAVYRNIGGGANFCRSSRKITPVFLAKGLFHRSLGQAQRRPRIGIRNNIWLKVKITTSLRDALFLVGNEFG